MATIFWLSIYGVHIGATWRIRMNCPSAVAMRPYVKLLWLLVFLWNRDLRDAPIIASEIVVDVCRIGVTL